MNIHTFFLQGITPKNSQSITSELTKIEGSKAPHYDSKIDAYVFAVISPIAHDQILSDVLSVISGTGAVLFQANII